MAAPTTPSRIRPPKQPVSVLFPVIKHSSDAPRYSKPSTISVQLRESPAKEGGENQHNVHLPFPPAKRPPEPQQQRVQLEKAWREQLEGELREQLVLREGELRGRLERELAAREAEAQQATETAKGQIQSLGQQLENSRAAISELKSQLHEAFISSSLRERELGEQVNWLKTENTRLGDRLLESESLRRVLFNECQEARGNIRVFCRIRAAPSQPGKGEVGDSVFSLLPDQRSLALLQPAPPNSKGRPKSHSFIFDHVFAAAATQPQVFRQVSEVIQSALDGFRVCVFCYGQTGSGKTFTMLGGKEDQSVGLIPRAALMIFDKIEQLQSIGWRYSVAVSALEIYNEQVRDLLGAAGSPPIEIRLSPTEEGSTVCDAAVEPVSDAAALLLVIERSARERAVASTACNERSSRSHAVFQLRIQGENSKTKEKTDGLLNLVDLAGSERLSQSKSTGDRLRETQAINSSLSSLGDVIVALHQRSPHVPYRNSKLTFLLQGSLGGSSGKTLMFVNVTDAPESVGETLSSLRFADTVSKCHIGVAKKQ